MLTLLRFTTLYYFKKSIELIYLYIFFITSLGMIGLLGLKGGAPNITPMLWVLVLFVVTLSIHQCWSEDDADGTLDQWRVSGLSLEMAAMAKWLVQVALVLVPVACIAGWGSNALALMQADAAHIALIIGLGGAQMLAIGMMAAAATVGLKQTAGVVGLVLLPLAAPTMLWGSEALRQDGSSSAIIMLVAYTALCVPLSCIASAACLRASD